ncbi:HSP40/DnaJ peptide-binding protein [Oscillospiraceae bacterium CLA-AA-H232]|uniref:HSP40/DnaJ peptide-binding protein n=1 Tax=Hominilimicola fabiformis TaxID=2885356 RepID=A0AAE3DYW5_9FIRM|nr:HSP40/DnaJ peptide-binding protein [Hominilimicola fabiformis]
MRGSDVYTTVEIAFEESILGCRKEITVQHEEICPCSNEENRTDNCTICNNTGKVLKKFIYDISIPRGIFSGQVLKIKGKGNVGINGGENGDLVINIQVKQKKGFARTGQDVVYYMTISFPQAVLGAVINVPTAYGTVNCEIPAGIKPGEQLCLAGYFFKNC